MDLLLPSRFPEKFTTATVAETRDFGMAPSWGLTGNDWPDNRSGCKQTAGHLSPTVGVNKKDKVSNYITEITVTEITITEITVVAKQQDICLNSLDMVGCSNRLPLGVNVKEHTVSYCGALMHCLPVQGGLHLLTNHCTAPAPL